MHPDFYTTDNFRTVETPLSSKPPLPSSKKYILKNSTPLGINDYSIERLRYDHKMQKASEK